MQTIAALLATAIAAFGGISTSTPQTSVHCVTLTRTVALGSTGNDVAQLQNFLGVKPTGFFGPLTQGTLTRWQISAHIIVSVKSPGAGTTGPKTRAALKCQTVMPVATNTVATSTAKIVMPPPPPSPTIITPSPTPAPSPAPVFGGGGGSGGGASAAQPQCQPFTTPQPPASQCEWPWQLVEDEAGCPAEWDCSDPNATE